ncbi:MAG TPA: Tat pathway signal sequence domain protein [Caulobacteraceae bacterium]|nr:Tat pathway signal sequence domain protein [Caulobacteraceae bacterium]
MSPLRTLVMIALSGASLSSAGAAYAQYGGGEGESRQDQQQQEEEQQRKTNEEFNTNAPGMPKLHNVGPCPYVKTLYDAARYIQFEGGREASAAVQYSGEIEDLASGCAYKADEPIQVRIQALFAFGRGPQARSSRKDFPYWIAVTDRNRAVLAKETFVQPVVFPAGKDRVTMTVNLPSVTIPRATPQVSGSNFEILIGFEVTPQMADFNRLGKRFLANAGQTSASTPQAPPPSQ